MPENFFTCLAHTPAGPEKGQESEELSGVHPQQTYQQVILSAPKSDSSQTTSNSVLFAAIRSHQREADIATKQMAPVFSLSTSPAWCIELFISSVPTSSTKPDQQYSAPSSLGV